MRDDLTGLYFQVDGELAVFEKASADEGKRRRIAGIISTETRDRQHEVVLQEGLDLAPFMNYGYFNDNHAKGIDGIVGYPEDVKQFKKGEELPNGDLARTNCTWAEGYLLEGSSRADEIWKTAQALNKTGGRRNLGFSIEGTVQKRTGADNKTVAKAAVTACAVTQCPVNTDTKMEVLAKSLMAVEKLPSYIEMLDKALSMGTGTGPIATEGAQSGEGAGRVVAQQSLDSKVRPIGVEEDEKKKKKKLSKSEAIAWAKERLPNASEEQISRFVNLVFTRASAQE